MASAEKRGKTWRSRYKKPDGTWGSEPGFPTKAAALKFGHDQESKVGAGKFIDPKAGRITVGKWSDTWLNMIRVGPLSERNYRSRIRAQIRPRWEKTAVADVKTSEYRIWMNLLRAEQSKDYCDNIEMTFRMMLDDAVVEGVIGTNPIPVQRRRRGQYEPEDSGEDTYVYPDPLQALLLAENARIIRGFVGEVMILTMAYTGMRIGEIVGLRREFCWVDPGRDEFDRHIRVEWQGQWLDKGRGFTLLPPKYGSRRTLILPPFLADLLWKLLDSHDKEHVFPAVRGGPMRADDQFYGRFWQPIVEGHDALPQIRGRRSRPEIPAVAGLSGLDPHGTRHGQRVWLEEDDIADSAIDERMGHKVRGKGTKAGKGVLTYRHVTPAMRKRIAKSLQRRWERSLRDREKTNRS